MLVEVGHKSSGRHHPRLQILEDGFLRENLQIVDPSPWTADHGMTEVTVMKCSNVEMVRKSQKKKSSAGCITIPGLNYTAEL
jgi:hypothetical protein